MSTFGEAERNIVSLFAEGETFCLDGKTYRVNFSGKPTCSSGEPKTDIYVNASDKTGSSTEIKISFKKDNADFLENKISNERAEQLFGKQWGSIVEQSTLAIKDKFLQRPLIYKKSFGNTKQGSITLGWKFELLNKLSGKLSQKIILSDEQIIDVYAGTGLSEDKKNAFVNGNRITNSGIANYILATDNISCLADIISNIQSIDLYAKNYPDIYFACKALNYRTFQNKWDGNRPLAVFINWTANNGKLIHDYVFNAPLITKGNSIAIQLQEAMSSLSIETTNNINEQNIISTSIVHGA